jgi:mycothiol synthase
MLAIMSEPHVVVQDWLSADEIARVLRLIDAAAEADGVHPLSEHAMLALQADLPGQPGLLAMSGDRIVGYARHDQGSAEMVVDPGSRRQGHGRALAEALTEVAAGPLRVWAHGDLPAAAGLAGELGWTRVRALWQMRRPLADPLPDAPAPAGVRIRTFETGRDEEAWTAVNRRAFADHPEQGAWTLDDLYVREREPWFDPAGLFLAESEGAIASATPTDLPRPTPLASRGESEGALLGFHWTKVHDDELGEVYVVGVDPAAQGLGLGRVLTVAGLHFLRARGLTTVMLYVDDDNPSAVKLYESLGFTRWSVDVMYET